MSDPEVRPCQATGLQYIGLQEFRPCRNANTLQAASSLRAPDSWYLRIIQACILWIPTGFDSYVLKEAQSWTHVARNQSGKGHGPHMRVRLGHALAGFNSISIEALYAWSLSTRRMEHPATLT